MSLIQFITFLSPQGTTSSQAEPVLGGDKIDRVIVSTFFYKRYVSTKMVMGYTNEKKSMLICDGTYLLTAMLDPDMAPVKWSIYIF